MKKAIFLVEDIKDGKIITLLEKKYEKLIGKLHEEHLPFQWISEICTILNVRKDNYIRFIKASDFVREVKNTGVLPADASIYYFISAWLHISSFSLTNFFCMDPDVTDFLVENQIPIIIDGSMEMDEISLASFNLFENTGKRFIEKRQYFRDIHKLMFYFVGGSVSVFDHIARPRTVKVNHCFFPAAFLHIAYPESNAFIEAQNRRDLVISKILSKKITEESHVWQAFCRTPRLTRILFQLYAQQEGITEYGRFSRLIPCKEVFLEECAHTGILDKYPDRLKFVNKKVLKKLDTLHHIDKNIEKDGIFPIGLPFDNNPMFHIVLETCPINCGITFDNTPLMLTEKTSMAILSGVPFITLGGHGIREVLLHAGFKEYSGLELPDSRHQNFFDQLDYVIEKVKIIINLPLSEKQNLYDSWKEIIIHNYDRYLSLDPQKLYLEFLERSI